MIHGDFCIHDILAIAASIRDAVFFAAVFGASLVRSKLYRIRRR